MELTLNTAQQHAIANLLWTAQSQAEVNEILSTYGHVAHVVHHLMIAAAFDEITDVSDAAEVLGRF